jgi:hypothetical protein
VHKELAVQLRGDAGRVLSPVLQEQQAVIDQLMDWGVIMPFRIALDK